MPNLEEGPLKIADETLYGDIPNEDDTKCICVDEDDECCYCLKRRLDWEHDMENDLML